MEREQNQYHGITKQSFATENFNISFTSHKGNSVIPMHAHSKPYLCAAIQGNYKEKSIGEKSIDTGTVLYRNANYEHANQFSEEDGICLNLEFSNPTDFNLQNDLLFPESELEKKATLDLSKLIIALNRNVSDDQLDIMCYEYACSYFNKNRIKGKLEWIDKIKGYIQDDPFQPISLNKISHEFQLHPNYVVRKFKEKTGLKLSEYLEKVRIENALQQLMKTNKSFSEIAHGSGFYDQSHFNRTFKKQMGITPNNYKKILKG